MYQSLVPAKILIVDDNAFNLIALRKILNKLDATIIEAESGEQSLKLCLEHQFAVILLDVQMPKMSGYEVATLLAQHQKTRRIPIIFITAVYDDENHQMKAYESGAVDYIQKPINSTILLSKVTLFLELHQQTLQLQLEIKRRKEAELQLRHQHDHLQELVNEQTQSLKNAKEAAEKSNALKSLFLAAMSHEIRTPIGGIIGLLQLLMKTNIDKKQHKYLQTLIKSSNSLLNIINDILDFSKISAGKLSLNYQEFNLRESLRHTIDLLYHPEDNHIVAVNLIYPDNTIENIYADPVRVNQVITNFLGNALKFTEAGHIDVIVESRQVQDKVHISIHVKDTGIGIPEDQLGDIFHIYTQIQNKSQKKHKGTGLGLSICSAIAKLMNGSVSVSSQLHQGSTFSFHFTVPITGKNPAPDTPKLEYIAPVEDQNTLPPVATSRILIAEDNEINTMILQEFFLQRKFQVDIAVNGRLAAEKAMHTPYQLILMDIEMPEMNGLDSTKVIRNQSQVNAQTPIIAITANSITINKEMCLSNGMNDYYLKPMRPQELWERLQHYLLPINTANNTDKRQETIQKKTSSNKQIFNFQTALQTTDGNLHWLKQILEISITTFPRILSQLINTTEQKNMLHLQRLAHALKGDASHVAAQEIYEIALTLEKYATCKETPNKDDLQYIHQLLKELETAMQKFKEEIKQLECFNL